MNMSSTPAHPSFLILDRMSLGLASPEASEHVAACAVCQQYLRALAEAPAAPPSPAVWSAVAHERKRARTRYLSAGASLLAAAACLALLGRASFAPLPEQKEAYVAAKGFPSVWIYVKRGAAVQLWDGKQAVATGDRLRIKLDPATFRRVEVYSVKDPQAPQLLYAGAVAPGQSTLPEAWEVDAEPGAERLAVVLASGPTQPAWDRWLSGDVPADVSVHSFVLPKSTGATPEGGGSSP
jgi:hypothetical protein